MQVGAQSSTAANLCVQARNQFLLVEGNLLRFSFIFLQLRNAPSLLLL